MEFVPTRHSSKWFLRWYIRKSNYAAYTYDAHVLSHPIPTWRRKTVQVAQSTTLAAHARRYAGIRERRAIR